MKGATAHFLTVRLTSVMGVMLAAAQVNGDQDSSVSQHYMSTSRPFHTCRQCRLDKADGAASSCWSRRRVCCGPMLFLVDYSVLATLLVGDSNSSKCY